MNEYTTLRALNASAVFESLEKSILDGDAFQMEIVFRVLESKGITIDREVFFGTYDNIS